MLAPKTGLNHPFSRRSFLSSIALGISAAPLVRLSAAEKTIQGFEAAPTSASDSEGWRPLSDRKIKVGIVGYGVCQFGSAFGFQDHPNVEVVAVSDLMPDRCAELAKACRCQKTYPSLEELGEG